MGEMATNPESKVKVELNEGEVIAIMTAIRFTLRSEHKVGEWDGYIETSLDKLVEALWTFKIQGNKDIKV